MHANSKAQLLRALEGKQSLQRRHDSFHSGLDLLDELAPGGAFRFGAVHELLWDRRAGAAPASVALLLARAAGNGAIAWSDPQREIYPPALAQWGIDLRRVILLRPKDSTEELWAVAECLRCGGLSATVAMIAHLNRVQARRLQLAAESGGGVGIFLRPNIAGEKDYAAATRWLVRPAVGDGQTQRWSIELVHGHGGHVGKNVLLGVSRESGKTIVVRASSPLAHRPPAPASQRATG